MIIFPRKQLLDFKSLNVLVDESRRLGPLIPRDIQAVVGIPRSGMIPAYGVALSAGNLPVWSLREFVDNVPHQKGHTRQQETMLTHPEHIKRALLIDDVVLTGGSLSKAKTLLASTKLERIVTCAPYVTAGMEELVDIASSVIEAPCLYEWNLLSHKLIEQCCIDMDGVLCFDPHISEDDDAEKYRAFLENAVPRFRFDRKIKAIVTSRLEKYRTPTEAWLKKHDVFYERLYMLDAPDLNTKKKFDLQSPFKAKIYRHSGATCFIESDDWQAQQVANLSGMSVICTDLMRLVHPSYTFRSPFWLRRVGKPIARNIKRRMLPNKGK